jgi:hypothetical protein
VQKAKKATLEAMSSLAGFHPETITDWNYLTEYFEVVFRLFSGIVANVTVGYFMTIIACV